MCDYSGYRKCKIKTIKCYLVTIMHYAIVLSFLQQLAQETWGLWIFSAKCDVILRIRRISFDMPQGYMRMPR